MNCDSSYNITLFTFSGIYMSYEAWSASPYYFNALFRCKQVSLSFHRAPWNRNKKELLGEVF